VILFVPFDDTKVGVISTGNPQQVCVKGLRRFAYFLPAFAPACRDFLPAKAWQAGAGRKATAGKEESGNQNRILGG